MAVTQEVPDTLKFTDCQGGPALISLPRSRFLDVTQRSPNVAWHPKNGCEGDYALIRSN